MLLPVESRYATPPHSPPQMSGFWNAELLGLKGVYCDKPKKIDEALPANLACGCPAEADQSIPGATT